MKAKSLTVRTSWPALPVEGARLSFTTCFPAPGPVPGPEGDGSLLSLGFWDSVPRAPASSVALRGGGPGSASPEAIAALLLDSAADITVVKVSSLTSPFSSSEDVSSPPTRSNSARLAQGVCTALIHRWHSIDAPTRYPDTRPLSVSMKYGIGDLSRSTNSGCFVSPFPSAVTNPLSAAKLWSKRSRQAWCMTSVVLSPDSGSRGHSHFTAACKWS
mmetsp:Transcript_52642/g.107352  ORF Transcript_52642/g.107352 Transcript_52642/m.107352 type:complete len:216 (-) Transcript_52642:404-1051(-)